MKRRKALQSIAVGTLGSGLSVRAAALGEERKVSGAGDIRFKSHWDAMPDMIWIGEQYWANRLQDWQIREGYLECVVCARNRNVHLLTHQINSSGNRLNTSVDLQINQEYIEDFEGDIGFSVGLKGRYVGYQSACITGRGINLGIDHAGRLFVGEDKSPSFVSGNELVDGVNLNAEFFENKVTLIVRNANGSKIGLLEAELDNAEKLEGNIALLVNGSKPLADEENGKVLFGNWEVSGNRIDYLEDQTFGPVYFTQYTLEDKVLKITAQIAPIDIEGLEAILWFEKGGQWEKEAASIVRRDSRTAHFRIEDWDGLKEYPFKVTVGLLLANGDKVDYSYSGSIAKEPVDKETLVAFSASCNGDFGFPDHEVVAHGLKHNPDLVFFLGDQIYEGNGGYGVQNNPPYKKADLDFLRKWYLFGWSYRDLFRNKPSICLPDDHDVFHGNVWGEGGKKTIQEGTTKEKQDTGGYKLPADWVNMIQICQTSHMPDPYDPTPIKQGIGVYYTGWKYGGLDFAIIEDRKFKSAPKNYFPDEADVENGFAQNLKFDFKSFQEPDVLNLLGNRQMKFLNEWTEDWSKGVQMKALLSATSFMTLQTLPKGTKNDSVTGKLDIPEKGEYVQGDDLTRDMDSNGWPISRRNEVVTLLRKSHAVHIVGDQHLPSVAQYGVDRFGDSNFVFTVPALSNIFPRRWWPQVSAQHQPLVGRPEYTGDFEDGFGNKMTVFAAASPYKSHRNPAQLYDRSTGYGIVKFHKDSRKIRFECWPRYMDPETQKEGQYADWPIEIRQTDNFAYTSPFRLPRIQVLGMDRPVVKLFDNTGGELVSIIRINQSGFVPKVMEKGVYKVVVGDPDTNRWKELVVDTEGDQKEISIDFT
ncbi:alkaline phosphatase D family protein [Membranihabitans maritimus]|uniref:alkaline phosphatase D family protein n=1 Tax=Membranihabitans maritimus TaxID=2904244 RepID=UPI001F3BAF13|nr:alkaline phosphatase D family protein [Membranihabitans maritimus]